MPFPVGRSDLISFTWVHFLSCSFIAGREIAACSLLPTAGREVGVGASYAGPSGLHSPSCFASWTFVSLGCGAHLSGAGVGFLGVSVVFTPIKSAHLFLLPWPLVFSYYQQKCSMLPSRGAGKPSSISIPVI
jgi:hypothetical protein